MMKRWKERGKKMATLLLAAVLLGNSVDLSAVTVLAAEDEKQLTCTKEEHTHDESCYEKVLVCADESDGHEHGDECYGKTLICGKEEHIHGESCYAVLTPSGLPDDSTNPDPATAPNDGADPDAKKASEDGEAQAVITSWEWIDEYEILEDGEFGAPNAATYEEVTELLPAAILAVVEGQTGQQTLAVSWSCDGFPKSGKQEGTYTFTAAPEEEHYALADSAEALTIRVTLGGGAAYAYGDPITGNCGPKDANGNYTDTVQWKVGGSISSVYLYIWGNGPMADFTEFDTPWAAAYNSGTIRKEVKSITVGSGVTKIGDYAFCGFENLTGADLPNSVTSIGRQAFADCKSLTDIGLYEHSAFSELKTIGEGAFQNTGLTKITIPSGVTAIEAETFDNCRELATVTLLGEVTTIGKKAFWYCQALQTIALPSSLESIGESAFKKTSLKKVVIPERVTSIGKQAFYNMGDALQDIAIPCNTTTFGESCLNSGWFAADPMVSNATFRIAKGSPADTYLQGCGYLKDVASQLVYDQKHPYANDSASGKHKCTVCGYTEDHDFGAEGTDFSCSGCGVKNINYSEMIVKQDTLTYDGTSKKPTFTITSPKEPDSEGMMTVAMVTVDASNYKITFPDHASEGDGYAGETEVKTDGDYSATLIGCGEYAGTRKVPWNIERAVPEATHFDFVAPTAGQGGRIVYDGTAKEAAVTVKAGINGMGTITAIQYYDSKGDLVTDADGDSCAPADAGTYQVRITVNQGNNYKEVDNKTTDSWNFTIEKAIPVFDEKDIPTLGGTYGQKLSDMTLSKTTATSKNGIVGSWHITAANSDSVYPSVEDQTTAYQITFTPDNLNNRSL